MSASRKHVAKLIFPRRWKMGNWVGNVRWFELHKQCVSNLPKGYCKRHLTWWRALLHPPTWSASPCALKLLAWQLYVHIKKLLASKICKHSSSCILRIWDSVSVPSSAACWFITGDACCASRKSHLQQWKGCDGFNCNQRWWVESIMFQDAQKVINVIIWLLGPTVEDEHSPDHQHQPVFCKKTNSTVFLQSTVTKDCSSALLLLKTSRIMFFFCCCSFHRA